MNLTPQQIATKFARTFGVVKAKNLLLKIFPSLENLSGRTLNLPQIIEDCHQSEARNFETAQHVDKWISDVSSTIHPHDPLQNGTKIGAITPRGFGEPRKNIAKTSIMRTNLCILSNSTKFSAGRPLRMTTMASTSSTYRLGAVASIKFLATENMPGITVKLRVVD